MATCTATHPHMGELQMPVEKAITFREAMNFLSREERFMATVSAMNTLLIQKGVYTTEEMEAYYCQWAVAQLRKPKKHRPGWRSRLASLLTF